MKNMHNVYDKYSKLKLGIQVGSCSYPNVGYHGIVTKTACFHIVLI